MFEKAARVRALGNGRAERHSARSGSNQSRAAAALAPRLRARHEGVCEADVGRARQQHRVAIEHLRNVSVTLHGAREIQLSAVATTGGRRGRAGRCGCSAASARRSGAFYPSPPRHTSGVGASSVQLMTRLC
eukprot:3162563-Pleurochrysis_carterae.AAC.4